MRKHSLRQTANVYLQTDNRGTMDEKKRRRQVIHNMIDDLFLIGDVPAKWQSLTADHLKKLIRLWHKRKIQPTTMMKHMTIIRKFLTSINHPLTNIDNQSLNIKRKPSRSKKLKVSHEYSQRITNQIGRLLFNLQIHFGLTLSEAMRLMPDVHIQQYALWITREIAFNSCDRFVPFRTETQYQILSELHSITKDQNLSAAIGEKEIHLAWRKTMKELKLPSSRTYRYLYAQHLNHSLVNILNHYRLSLLIMDEMGLKSRTTLWRYLYAS